METLSLQNIHLGFFGELPRKINRRLEQLKFLRERPDYHPEKSVYEHIKIVTNRVISYDKDNRTLVAAGLLHDICKLDTVKENVKTGWPTSPGHESAAKYLILENEDIRNWLVEFGADVEKTAMLCEFHMRFHQLAGMKKSKQIKYTTMWKEAGIMNDLIVLGAADNMLREFNPNDITSSIKWITTADEELINLMRS